MKLKILLAILFLSVLSGCSTDRISDQNDAGIMSLHGNIKNLITYIESEYPNDNSCITDKCRVITFDSNGYISNIDGDKVIIKAGDTDSIFFTNSHYGETPSPELLITKREYDEKHIIVSSKNYGESEYENTSVLYKTEIEFDRNNRIVSITDNGLIPELFMDNKSYDYFNIYYEYGKDNREEPESVKFKYSLYGNETEEYFIFNYTRHDMTGNWTEREYLNPENGNRIFTETRHIDYYINNNE